jgi:hypothetical protein
MSTMNAKKFAAICVIALGTLMAMPAQALAQAEYNDSDGDSVTPAAGDCDDNDALAYPNALETCDGIDNDCDGLEDEDVDVLWRFDNDKDDWGGKFAPTSATCSASTPPTSTAGLTQQQINRLNNGQSQWVLNRELEFLRDCQDNNFFAHPLAYEWPFFGDLNCDGKHWSVDADGDGWTGGQGDRNDNPLYLGSIFRPGAPETCDGFDNDADGNVDEANSHTFSVDVDRDGFCVEVQAYDACLRGFDEVLCDADKDGVADPLEMDCDDSDGTKNIMGVEICNGEDDNCDGSADEGLSCPA